MPFWKCYYHIVWATKHRAPIILSAYEQVIQAAITDQAEQLNSFLLAINMVSDHIHVAASIPPAVAIAEWVGKVKGASSRAINTNFDHEMRFHWQEGYGVLSFGEKALFQVTAYIANQKEHHTNNTTNPYLERIEE